MGFMSKGGAKTTSEKTSTIISAVVQDLTFSSESVYVWVKLHQAHYEFTSDHLRERQARSISQALANLLTSDEKALTCQLIVTTKHFNVNAWEKGFKEASYRGGRPTEAFDDYVDDMADTLRDYEFDQRATYVGIKLGDRREFGGGKKTEGGIPFLKDALNKLTAQVDEYVSDKEFDFWDSRANLTRRSLYESDLGADKVVADELVYMIAKNFHPAMPTPAIEDFEALRTTKWGKGEIETLTTADIINKPFWLQINQMVDGEEYTGFRATLSFAKFPDSYSFPEQEPWIHSTAGLDAGLEFYSRFEIVPSKIVKKQVGNKIKEIQDQVYNQTSAGGSVSLEMQDRFDQGQALEFQLGKDDTPWLFGRHHITVEAETEKELKEKCQEVIDHYKGLGILVVWSAGDQVDLLLEELPGEKVRMNAYYQRHQLDIIGVGIPNGGGVAGDDIEVSNGKKKGWIGPYMGYTTSRVLEPVFISIHSAIDRNNPPTLVITGSPGSGKSFCAFTLTTNMVLSGTQVVLIDPKGEASQLADVPGLGDPIVVDLQESHDGMLDPFQMGDTAAMKLDLALDASYMLLGGRDSLSAEAESELIKAIRIVIKTKYPSMVKLKEVLKASRTSAEGRSLGERLDLISELPMSNLCFANTSKKVAVQSLHMSKTLTIINLKNLDLPGSTTKKEDYSMRNTLAVTLLFLITSFAKNLMIQPNSKDPDAKARAKAIVVDEAWAITSTQQGAKLIESVARLGRSANTGLVLVSQNAKDFLGGAVTNSVSMKLAFKANSPEEVADVIKFFNLEEGVGNEEVISQLGKGQCLLADASRRVARVQIDGWNPVISKAIETNPNARKQNLDEESAA